MARDSEKHPSEGSRRGARARHSLRKPVAPRLGLKNGQLVLKRQILKMMSQTMSLSICDNLEKDCLVADAALNATVALPPIREPNVNRSLFADLEPSEPDDRPVDRRTLFMFNTLKTL